MSRIKGNVLQTFDYERHFLSETYLTQATLTREFREARKTSSRSTLKICVGTDISVSASLYVVQSTIHNKDKFHNSAFNEGFTGTDARFD